MLSCSFKLALSPRRSVPLCKPKFRRLAKHSKPRQPPTIRHISGTRWYQTTRTLLEATPTDHTTTIHGEKDKATVLVNMRKLWTCLKENIIQVETRQCGETTLDVISLPEGIHWPTEDSRHLFVRQCYAGLYEKVMACNTDPEPGALILGNPGIGKSWFLSYCFYRLVTDEKTRNKPIFFETVSRGLGFSFDVEQNEVIMSEYSKGYPDFLDDSDVVYLFDPAGNKTGREPVGVNAFTIVAAPPNRVHYHFFQKSRKTDMTFYMPVWTRQEIQCVEEADYMGYPLSKDTLRARFDLFGGIPRYLFCPTEEVIPPRLEAIMDSAMANLKVNMLPRLYSPRLVSEMAKGSDMLVKHYSEAPDYNMFTTTWTSWQMANRALDRLIQNDPAAFSNFFAQLAGGEDMVIDTFALVAHRLLAKGMTFNLWCDGDCNPFPLPPLNRVVFDALEQVTHFENETYYQSASLHFGTTNSLAYVNKQVFWFQVALNSEQDVNEEALKRALDHLERCMPGVPITYVFVTNAYWFAVGVSTPSQPTLFKQAFKRLATLNVKPAILRLVP